jgi:uncharacterized protein YjdB
MPRLRKSRFARRLLIAITACGLGACKDSPAAVVPVASLELTAPWTALSVGETVLLKATPFDASGAPLADRPIEWSSSDSTVVSVTTSGLARATGQGRATVTARVEVHSAQVTLTVAGR